MHFLCISRLHSDLRKLFHLLWSATYQHFFFWLCFETPVHSWKCVYLPESEKKCHFETAIKVNAQGVCITKPSPVAAPFVSSLPVSLFFSSLQADHENVFSFSQSLSTAFRENKQNIHLIAGENPMAFFQWFQVMLSMSTLFAYCLLSKCYCNI